MGECSLPTTQETGAFDLDISEENSQKLSLELKEANGFDLKVITTGDDDPHLDCSHTEMKLEVKYT